MDSSSELVATQMKGPEATKRYLQSDIQGCVGSRFDFLGPIGSPVSTVQCCQERKSNENKGEQNRTKRKKIKTQRNSTIME
jgi:hypothetical protein